MNGIKCPAIEAKFQLVLLIETKYDVEQEAQNSKGCDAKCHWRDWKLASYFTEICGHGRRLLLAGEKL